MTTPTAPPRDDLTRRVADAIADLQSDGPLTEVVVVSPPGPTPQTLRRTLAAGRGFAGLRFDTPIDLARQIVSRVDGPLVPSTPLVLAAAVQHELTERCPTVLQTVATHPSTVEAIVAVADRLRFVPIGAGSDGVVSPARAGDSHHAIWSVAAAARRRLRELGYHDDDTTLRRAVELVGQGRAPVERLVVVLADCFQPAQVGFVRALTEASPAFRIVSQLDWPSDHDLAAQAVALGAAPAPGDSAPATARRATLTSCPDQDEEVRHVVRTIVAEAAGGGGLDHVVVLHPIESGYRRRITDELDRAGLQWVGTAPQTLAESMPGTVLRLAFDAFSQPDRAKVLRLLAAAPHRVARDEAPRRVSRWRRVCRTENIVRAADWELAAARLHAGQVDERDREPLAHLLALVDVVHAAADALTDPSCGWAAAARALDTLLNRLVGEPNPLGGPWRGFPDWQFKAAEQIIAAIDAIGAIDAAPLDQPYSLVALERLVRELLAQPVRKIGANGPGVRVLPYTDAICLDAAIVYVVGAGEGTLPPRRVDEALRPAHRDDADPLSRFVEHDRWHQHRCLRAWHRLMASTAEVRASWPRSDLRQGGTVFPSRLLGADDGEVHVVESHAGELESQAALGIAEHLVRDDRMWVRSPVLHRRARTLISRSLPVASEFDGQVGPGRLEPFDAVHSITAFESLARCGSSYFVRHVLGAREERDPAESDTIDPLDKGDLVHRVFETLVAEWSARDPRPDWLSADHVGSVRDEIDRLLDVLESDLRERGRLGHPMRWRIDRRQIADAIAAALDGEHGPEVTPLAAEHAFGFDGGDPALEVDTARGTVRFRGYIDRIDLVDGQVRVTDFKTTSAREWPKVPRTDPTEDGTKLQLPLYTLVAQRAFGDPHLEPAAPQYLYVRGREAKAIAFPPDAIDRAIMHVGRIADLLAAGDLRPAAPDPQWGCPDCCPDGLGIDHATARAELLRRTDGDESGSRPT